MSGWQVVAVVVLSVVLADVSVLLVVSLLEEEPPLEAWEVEVVGCAALAPPAASVRSSVPMREAHELRAKNVQTRCRIEKPFASDTRNLQGGLDAFSDGSVTNESVRTWGDF